MEGNTCINLDHVCKEFSNKIYQNCEEDILNDMFDTMKKISIIRKENFTNDDNYLFVKLLKSIFAYCGEKNIDLNKYFSLSV